ncbi:MAG TPA: Na+/H+ antiporter NhaA, partial [Thermoleophilaceae bacterium]|nr:Na+/H+ antiporter NhaA [Thermoleophilaceae bacterium]
MAAPVRDFLNTETASATALLGAAVAALVWANSPWSDSYESFWTTTLSIRIGDEAIALELREWVSEGLMAFAFLVVGGDGADGWGAAMSTDTAFALGVLALVAPGAARLRVRLLTLVVIDDLVALLVIATVYTESVDPVALALACALFALLLALRWAPVAMRSVAAALLGVGVWVA